MKKIAQTIEKMSKILLILMISISQISFPLEVLADELMQDEPVQEELTEIETGTKEAIEKETDPETETETEEDTTTSKYKVMINGEEVTEYTVPEDNKVLTITQEYDGEEGTYTFDNLTESIDFTNMLYGDYQYVYSVSNTEEVLESKTITIHYEGDNSEILSSSTTLKYVDGIFYVKGNKELLTVEDVLNQFDTEKLENDYSSNLQIKDLEDNELIDTDNVLNEYQLVLTNEVVTENYTLMIEGDYTNDSLVDESDAQALIDKILNDEINDLNGGNPFDILDATNPVFTTGSWENNLIVQDDLTNALQSKEEVNKGEELVVKYYINGFEYDILTGIQGKINYTEELLELKSIEVNSLYNLYGNYNEDGKFTYLLNNYQSSDILLTLKFNTLEAGEATISIDEIIASTGIEAILDDNTISTTVTILDFGTGGDVEEVVTPEEPTPVTPEVETTSEVPQQTVSAPTTRTYVQRVTSSSDAFIEKLTIKGYQINFDKNTYEYSIKVKNSVKSLDLTVELSDEKATYTVEGNKNFKVGENIVTITVKAEDGTTKTYSIKVDREEKEEEETTEEEEVEEKSSSKTIIIILIVLVIIGLIYVIFKDDEEDSKESKK